MKQFYPLSTFLTEYSEKNGVNAYRPVAVGRYGIRTRESIYSKELAKDYSKNKLIHKNTLTVGMGSVQIDIGVLTDDITYSVSPAYHTYKIAGVNAEYLRYCLECRNQDMFSRFVKRGSRQGKTIDLKRWMTYEIPVYDENRQQEIVDRLNRISELIEKRQEQLVQLSELVKSRFIELFGDPVRNSMGLPTEPMTTVCAIIDGDRGKNYPKQDDFSDTGYCLFLNAKNVTATGFSFENRMFITKEKDNALHNGKLERGDVVLTTRGTLGNLAFYDDSVPFENVRINSGMVILRMNKSVMTEVFFMEQFKLQLQSIKGKIASGSAQPQLPISTMNKIRILLAPMALQEQFAAFVEQTDKSKLCGKMEVAA